MYATKLLYFSVGVGVNPCNVFADAGVQGIGNRARAHRRFHESLYFILRVVRNPEGELECSDAGFVLVTKCFHRDVIRRESLLLAAVSQHAHHAGCEGGSRVLCGGGEFALSADGGGGIRCHGGMLFAEVGGATHVAAQGGGRCVVRVSHIGIGGGCCRDYVNFPGLYQSK